MSHVAAHEKLIGQGADERQTMLSPSVGVLRRIGGSNRALIVRSLQYDRDAACVSDSDVHRIALATPRNLSLTRKISVRYGGPL